MFIDWLVEHINEDSAIGDFAREAAEDTALPRTDDYEELSAYLDRKGASFSAIEAFERAYKSYIRGANHG